MDDIFTDASGGMPDYEDFTEPVAGPAPTDALVETPLPEPVQDSPVDNESVPDVSPAPENMEPADGMAGVPDADAVTPTPVPAQDYTGLLTELQSQTEQLVTVSGQLSDMDRQLGNVQNAMPVLTVCLGIVIGILLLQVLSSYLRH